MGFYRDISKLTLESGPSAAKYSESFLRNEKGTRELVLPSQTCRSVSVASDGSSRARGRVGERQGEEK